MKDLILFGVQGSGKGTQARLFVEKHGYVLFETGKELRALADDESSELGRKVKGIIEAGNLVSDEVVIEIVEHFLQKTSVDEAVIFDGIPRKVSQMILFEGVVAKAGRKPMGVLIGLSDEEALRRLGNRWMSRITGKTYAGKAAALLECAESDAYQRADDTPEAIAVRLKNYHEETQPVIDWYRKQGRLVEVDGEQSAHEVLGQMEQLLYG